MTQFKVAKETERLAAVTVQTRQAKQTLEKTEAATENQKKKLEALQKDIKAAKEIGLTTYDIEAMGKKAPFGNNIVLTSEECRILKAYAIRGFAEQAEKLKYKQKYEEAAKDIGILKRRYLNLLEKTQPYLDALEIASEKVRTFLSDILARGKQEQERKQPVRKRRQELEL